MIPVKLSVRNFMPYRDNVPALYFGGIHTASICGNNGNGKSAIIDAITWALWGQTRAKRDDDIIHTGQNETEVEFEFSVDSQLYRIIRKHSRPKRQSASGQTSLDLFVSTDDEFKLISGNTIQQTQQKIIDTLHMDYDTFTNSAFLRQGHADEFTTANPARRKQVLANILGLSYYDTLEAKAKELAKKQEFLKEQYENNIEDINRELVNKPVFAAELKEAGANLSGIEQSIKEQETRLKELRHQKETLENYRWQLGQLDQHMTQRRNTLVQWNEQIKTLSIKIREHESLIAQQTAIEQGYDKYIEAKLINDELDSKFRRSVNLERQKTQLEIKIKEASQNLLTQHAVLKNKTTELEENYRKLPDLKSRFQQEQLKSKQIEQQNEILQQKKESYQQLRTNIHGMETGQTQLQHDIKEIGEKLDLLVTQQGAKCPLCETELGENELKLIEEKYMVDRRQKTESIGANQSKLATLTVELQTAEKELSEFEHKMNQDRVSIQSKLNLLNREITEAEKAGNELAVNEGRIREIEEQLTAKDFAVDQQTLLNELERELSGLDYDSTRHEEVRQHLSDLIKFEEPKRKLNEALKVIEQEKENAVRFEKARLEISQSLEKDEQKKSELGEALKSLPVINEELSRAEAENQNVVTKQKLAQETIGNIKGKLEHLEELEKRRTEKQKLLNQAQKEERIYKDLTEAFGKKGIQAMLIETARPEIEIEANKLLARMTDNRMHVKIDTQKVTKKGDTVETFDITIADELGTRSYEMFSGGEAFRINFSIRIALSRLLARRAGAPLPTLIIDEGFGTQDSTGIEKLQEAINSIQDDFEKILVITHIEELRDAFPVRIDVVKNADGSTISID